MESKLFKPSVPENFSLVNIENVCRICLQTGIALFSIFRNEINEMIIEFIPDKIDLQDNFPNQMCEKCIENVNIAYAFKKQAEYSHEIMKKMLNGKRLTRSSKHLEKAHKFFKIDENCGNISTNDGKVGKANKRFNENFLEDMSFPILPQIIMTDVENMPISDDNDEHSMEEKDELYKSHDREIGIGGNFDTQMQDQKEFSCNCHICHEHLSTLQDLKYHLEKKHQIHDTDDLDIKPKVMTFKNSNINESIELSKSLTPTTESLQKDDNKHLECLNNVANLSNENASSNKSVSSDLEKPQKSNETWTRTINVYICHICEKEFSCRTTTRRHLKNIHKFENFEDEIWLSKVYQKTIEDKVHECEICKKVYSKTKDLLRHQSLHSDKPRAKPYLCTICSKSFSRSSHLKTHVSSIHADLTREALFRGTEYLSNSKVEDNDKQVNTDEKQEIEAKDEKKNRQEIVELMVEESRKKIGSITNSKSYTCTTCSKSFTRSDILKNHVNSVHVGIRPFQCPTCQKSFTQKQHLNRHISRLTCSTGKKERKKEEKSFSCEICMKKFSREKHVRNHIATEHNKTREFSCKICSEKIIGVAEYNKHRKTHSAKDFLCSECGKSFAKLECLNMHMRIHTGEKPYSCQFCGKAFARKTEQYTHERLHKKVKNVHCQLCSKGFYTKHTLRVHMRTHTGERPYKCSYCPKAFAENSILTKHLRQHTGERFYCNLCGVSFVQMFLLRRHKRQVHGVIEPGGRVYLSDHSEKQTSQKQTFDPKPIIEN